MQKELSRGFRILTAQNGREALEVLGKENVSLVVSDVMMPEMDGQETLKNIRAIEEKKGLFGSDGAKIIMTTALDDAENIRKAFREQCESYLIKPINKSKLMETLEELGLKLQ